MAKFPSATSISFLNISRHVPVPDHPVSEEISPNIQPEPPVVQLEAPSLFPSACNQGHCVNAWVGSGACGIISHLEVMLAKLSELTHPQIFGKQNWGGSLPTHLWITSTHQAAHERNPHPSHPEIFTDKITLIPGTFYRERPLGEMSRVGQERAQAKITKPSKQLSTKAQTNPTQLQLHQIWSIFHGEWR